MKRENSNINTLETSSSPIHARTYSNVSNADVNHLSQSYNSAFNSIPDSPGKFLADDMKAKTQYFNANNIQELQKGIIPNQNDDDNYEDILTLTFAHKLFPLRLLRLSYALENAIQPLVYIQPSHSTCEYVFFCCPKTINQCCTRSTSTNSNNKILADEKDVIYSLNADIESGQLYSSTYSNTGVNKSYPSSSLQKSASGDKLIASHASLGSLHERESNHR